IYRKFNRKTKEYDRLVNVFEKYKVIKDEQTPLGRKITIEGPKQIFKLNQQLQPLKKLFPPEREGEKATVKEYTFFYVSPLGCGVSKIQGAIGFALIDGILVPYKFSGYSRHSVEPMA
ncbi:MAG TPA: hypothetical protein PKD85_23825, partial [Saprospiraceae bacterium]|nr:hypothetical protein [Saprospiraceae bacterium]